MPADNATMLIIIGSTNPVKRGAAENVLRQVFAAPRFDAFDVPSGVPSQPWGDEQTRQGAVNRAQAVLEHTQADIGVGLEGGIIQTAEGMMTTAWCVLRRRDGLTSLGGGLHLMLPIAVARMVESGTELGSAMDSLVGDYNTKQKGGAIGILTGGLLDRQRAYEVIITLAAAPFCQPDFYGIELR